MSTKRGPTDEEAVEASNKAVRCAPYLYMLELIMQRNDWRDDGKRAEAENERLVGLLRQWLRFTSECEVDRCGMGARTPCIHKRTAAALAEHDKMMEDEK